MTVELRALAERLGLGVLAVLALLTALGVAWLVPQQPLAAIGVAVVALVTVAALVNPVTLPLLAMPLIVVIPRVGGGGVDLSASDAMLALAFWPAVLMAPRPLSPALRQLLWLNAVYQATTLFTLLANPFVANTVEWFHAWLLVSGALLVGWAVGASGHARPGVSLFLTACLALALPTVAQGVLQFAGGNFSAVYPRWPFAMHKNFVGTVMAFGAVVAYAHPAWLGWSRRAALSSFWIFAAALAFSQSRQALIGLGVSLLIVSFRQHHERRRSVLVLAGLVPATYLVVTLIRDQIASGNEHNSWFQRLEWYSESVDVWLQSPWVGHGLRFWTQAGAPANFQPPNVVLEVLASTGLVGLAGFAVMMVGVLVVLWRLDPAVGTVAIALVAGRLVQAQLDIFWVSVSASVPFLLVGVCLGVAARGHPAPQPGRRDLAAAR